MTDKAPDAPEKALETIQADARGRRQEDGSVVVPLVTDDGTTEITVPHPALWFEGAVEALSRGQIGPWMKLALEGDELVKWNSVRKRYRDLDAFLTSWSTATGETPGESSASSAS